MTYGSDRILWKGRYGWVHRVALSAYNAGVRRARDEYREHPFINVSLSPYPQKIFNRRAWTQRDVNYLIRKREEGVPFWQIAKSLDRSKNACFAKAKKLGITKTRS